MEIQHDDIQGCVTVFDLDICVTLLGLAWNTSHIVASHKLMDVYGSETLLMS